MDTDTRSPFPEKQVNRNYLLQIFSLIFFLSHSVVYGQLNDAGNKKNASATTSGVVELSIIKNSDAPHTSPEHIYVVKAVNISEKTLSFSIAAKNINCTGKKNSDMVIQVYRTASGDIKSLSDVSGIVTIRAHSSEEFYVKLIRPESTLQNTWNCTEVKAITKDNHNLSEGIIIESFIPDPKDFK